MAKPVLDERDLRYLIRTVDSDLKRKIRSADRMQIRDWQTADAYLTVVETVESKVFFLEQLRDKLVRLPSL